MILPPPLKPGSRVHVVAPSGAFDRDLLQRGVAWLGERYRVTFRPDIFERAGFFAGSDQRRLDELSDALLDPSIDAVVTARGGHGLLRIVQAAPFGALVQRPKWLVGFSDPTALHLETTRVGVASLHAENVTGLGRSDLRTRNEWQEALEHPDVPREYHGETWTGGRASGPLVGGNLTLLTMAAAAGRLVLPRGCILALEDVAESSYRVDRMLTVLRIGGHFDKVSGFALGHFTDCSSGPHQVTAETVLRESIAGHQPTVARLEFGHAVPNHPLTLGATAVLDAERGVLITPA
jgi:muramoyltetrapeptide carboxypeptidase